MNLGFKIVRTLYPARSGITGVVVQKVRDDGRIGAVVGDEASLWDALQEALTALQREQQARERAEQAVRQRDRGKTNGRGNHGGQASV